MELAASSPGDAWSTLTAGSSSADAGSEPLNNLVQEQLQGLLTCPQPIQGAADAGAAAVAVEEAADVHAALPTAAGPAQPAAVAGYGGPPAEPGMLPQEQLPSAGVPQSLPHLAAAAAEPQQLQQQSPMQEEDQPAADNSLLAQPVGPQASADASQAAVALAESGQRLQQLLAQHDDTMLLMSFALKLDRLGRRFGPQGQVRRELRAAIVADAAVWLWFVDLSASQLPQGRVERGTCKRPSAVHALGACLSELWAAAAQFVSGGCAGCGSQAATCSSGTLPHKSPAVWICNSLSIHWCPAGKPGCTGWRR